MLFITYFKAKQNFFFSLLETNAHHSDDKMADFAVPSDKWSRESVELFNQLNELGSDWKKLYRDISTASDGSRSFLDCAVKDGKSFKYAFFCNAKLQCSKGVIEFGPYCRGPVGYVSNLIFQADIVYNRALNDFFSADMFMVVQLLQSLILPWGPVCHILTIELLLHI